MIKLFFQILILVLFPLSLWADNSDPNGYFKDRKWSLNNSKKQNIEVVSKYAGEPIQKPNRLMAYIQCPNKTKKMIVEGHQYCGLDSVSVLGNQLQILFTDYDSRDPRGYCMIKKQVQFPIPHCD